MTKRAWVPATVVFFLATLGLAQAPGDKQPSVIMAPVGNVQLRAGASTSVEIDFRVGSEFHINSHHPKADYLIPTVVSFRPGKEVPPVGQSVCISHPRPGDKFVECLQAVAIAETKYPVGDEVSFPFSPNEKLSVYSGDFSIITVLKAQSNAPPGSYPMQGELRFQACDHSACYPPRSIPVQFQVMVIRK